MSICETSSASRFSFATRSYDFAEYVDALNFVGGEWTAASSGEVRDVTNPRHGKVMGKVAWSGTADVAAAVSAARYC